MGDRELINAFDSFRGKYVLWVLAGCHAHYFEVAFISMALMNVNIDIESNQRKRGFLQHKWEM